MKKNEDLISMTDMKKNLLDEMKYIDNFCKENNINYFLVTGTLLGAARHKGFIPWDDDIDIGMLRDDYNKFLKLFFDKNGIYEIINIEKNENYYLPFTKVINKKTILLEEIDNGIPIGAGIDIFPFDNYPEVEERKIFGLKRVIALYSKVLVIKNTTIKQEKGLIRNIIIFLLKLLFRGISKKYIIKKIEMLSTKYETDRSSRYVTRLSYMVYGKKEIYERSWIERTIELEFESYKFKAPLEYKKILNKTFVNYMELPPIEQRIAPHSYKCWWRK